MVSAPTTASGQHTDRATAATPSIAALWKVLEAVADPEIPVVSVVELGIVRSLAWDESDPSVLIVRITPTYSGCPAHEVITAGIAHALMGAGVARIRIETQLSPPWSTDWIAAQARTKLREYGIAPPGAVGSRSTRIDLSGLRSLRRAPDVVACPRCGSERTRVLSQFGSTACKAQYRCDACLEPFDYFKPH
jgi:ring-1,2-phenylacetyl-CoA epoxidase subunit PaaD